MSARAALERGGAVMLYAGERAQGLQSKLVYRGYDLEVKRAPSGWRVGIYSRTADLPILSGARFLPVTKTRPWW